MRLRTTRRFERDLKLAGKRGKNLDRLWRIVERLLAREALEPRNRAHRLSGDWSHAWECHIEPDWLLVWQVDGDILLLVRTGTHAGLFG